MFVVLCVLSTSMLKLSEGTPQQYSDTRKDANSKFAGLLKDLVQINEERFATLKKLSRLQDYTLSKHDLRTHPETLDERDSQKPDLIIAVLEGRKPRESNTILKNNPIEIYGRTNQESSSNETESDFSEAENGGTVNFRQGKIGRYLFCRMACVSAMRQVCYSYTCRGSLKRRFRRACKRNCKRAVNG